MLARRYGSFTGGIDLPDEKQATAAVRSWAAPALARLRVPLSAPGRAGASVVVKPGQSVAAGELLARGYDDGVDVHAPLSGKVGSACEAAVAGMDGFETVEALELTDLSAPRAPVPQAPRHDGHELSVDELRRRLAGGGLTTCRLDHLPLGRFVEQARGRRVGIVIANAVEHPPYVTSRHRLLCEFGQDTVRGLAIIARAIGAPQVILAVDRRRTGSYSHLVNLAEMLQISRVAMPPKYPIGADVILTKILARREVPPGGDPMDVGVAVVDPACCLAAWRWVCCDEPLTARLVTVGGERLQQRGNAWLPLGTVCEDLLGAGKMPAIHGNPMTGSHCPAGAVVSAATDALLAIHEAPARPPSPCIRCGWCTDNCPARLNVALLNDAFELGLVDRALRRGVQACVECGLCSYLCPARLPLSQRVVQLKRLADLVGVSP